MSAEFQTPFGEEGLHNKNINMVFIGGWTFQTSFGEKGHATEAEANFEANAEMFQTPFGEGCATYKNL